MLEIIYNYNNIGENNPQYDHTLYCWFHKDGSEDCLTQNIMANKYKLDFRLVNSVVKRKRKSTGGWYCRGPMNDPWHSLEDIKQIINNNNTVGKNHNSYDNTVYYWVNVDGRDEYLTQYDMYIKHDLLQSQTNMAVKNNKKSVKGWFCIGVGNFYDKKIILQDIRTKKNIGDKHTNYNFTVFHWKHVNGNEEFATCYELYKKYNLRQSNVCNVMRQTRKSVGGWSLVVDRTNIL